MVRLIKEIVRWPAELLLRLYLSSLPRKEFKPENVNRILVFAYHGLGNFLMYTPALRALRECYPQARIDLQVGNNTGCEDVLAGSNFFDNIYNLPYKAGLKQWLSRGIRARRTEYDLTINEFHSHSWKLALLVALSRAPFRAGHVTSPGWSHRFSRFSFVFNIPVEMREDEHEVERYIDLVSAAGATPPEFQSVETFIHLRDEDRQFALNFLDRSGISEDATVIGIQPGTSPNMRWKQWPVERFRELLEQIVREMPDAHIVLFGSPSERQMIDEMARGLESNVVMAAGRTTVKQVAALIEQCDMLICNDSGLMHVAVAVKTPVVAIYGPTDIRRTSPLGAHNTVIRHALACSPCFKLEGEDQIHQCLHHDCLMTIDSAEVFRAVSEKASDRKLTVISKRQTI